MKKLSLLLFIGLSIAHTSFAHTIKIKNDGYRHSNTFIFYGKKGKILKIFYDLERKEEQEAELSSNVQKIKVKYDFKEKMYKSTRRARIKGAWIGSGSVTKYDDPVKMRLTGGVIRIESLKKVYYEKDGKTYLLSTKKGK